MRTLGWLPDWGQGYHVYVALSGLAVARGAVVGVINVDLAPQRPDRDYAYFRTISTHPDHRRQGIAAALLEHAMSEATYTDHSTIGTIPLSPASGDLLRSRGFAYDPERDQERHTMFYDIPQTPPQ